MLQRKFSLRCEITHSHGSTHSPLPLCFTLPGRFRAEVGMDTQKGIQHGNRHFLSVMPRQATVQEMKLQAYGCVGVAIWIIGLILGFTVGIDSPLAGWIIILVSLLLPFLLFDVIELFKNKNKEAMKICGSIFSVLLLVCLLIFCRQWQLFPSHRKFHGNWKS